MKTFFGLILMAAGLAFGAWAGIWWALIGGIVGVVEAIKAPEMDAAFLAVSIAKILGAGFIGWGSAFLAILPGYVLLESA